MFASGQKLMVSPAAPKLAGEVVVFLGWIGKCAKVSKIASSAEFVIWPSWLSGEPEWVGECAGAGC